MAPDSYPSDPVETRGAQHSIEQIRNYAASVYSWEPGQKTEDQLLQRMWNLADDVIRLLEQLEGYEIALRAATKRVDDLEEQLTAAHEKEDAPLWPPEWWWHEAHGLHDEAHHQAHRALDICVPLNTAQPPQ